MLVYDDISDAKIFIPKPIRKLNQQKKNKRRKKQSNLIHESVVFSNESNNIKLDLKNISIEEINNDFMSLAPNSEEEQCFNELYSILSCFSEEKTLNINFSKSNRIKRPKNTNNHI